MTSPLAAPPHRCPAPFPPPGAPCLTCPYASVARRRLVQVTFLSVEGVTETAFLSVGVDA
uniref:hypothetical protein n=1 Tax=Nonomuraea pusilla TaxID=46177 RepID=UPI0006E1C3B3|nr:hypothetical protein [Nonomuraea pusilla]